MTEKKVSDVTRVTKEEADASAWLGVIVWFTAMWLIAILTYCNGGPV